jgi:hypothetical protein
MATSEQLILVDYYPYMTTHWAGTIRKNFAGFSAMHDAEELRKALGGKGTDKNAVMAILCHRSNAERQEIKEQYNTMFQRDLIKDLIDELKGNFEMFIVALMLTPEDYDASELHHAIGRIMTDKHVLIEILCTRTNAEIRKIRASYLRIFGVELEEAIAKGTSGAVKNLLIALIQAARDESWRVSNESSIETVRSICIEGEKNWGNPDSKFITMITTNNYAQLQQIFREYHTYTAHTIEESVGQAFSGDMLEAVTTIIRAVKNLPAYFAELLHKAMSGLGTSDRELIRIIVSRSEKDLHQIKQQFELLYKRPLQHWIEEDTSGDYKKALLCIVRGAEFLEGKAATEQVFRCH